MATPNPRYQGKPLLRLLECYVLWSIDSLSPADAQLMNAMTPKLHQIYGATGTWQQVIETVMALPSSVPSSVRDLWAKNSNIARQKQMTLTPQQFAEMFVDQHLA